MNPSIDEETRLLVRFAAVVTGGSEAGTRAVIEELVGNVRSELVDEVILQSYLFAGFPRTLNAARMWRSMSGHPAPPSDDSASSSHVAEWESRGEETCAIVYGDSYEVLRQNVRELHPALDAWMITDGYGKVLSRPALDLKRRELCIVAACAAAGQQRQLHSHLHGALNSGAPAAEVRAALDAMEDIVPPAELARYRALLDRVVAARRAALELKSPTDVR
jgi:4-carboxymuconolactone decarboxylase